MVHMIEEDKQKEYIVLGILSVFVFGFVLLHLEKLTGIQHIYDESGYWSAAAYFNGLDWKDLASYNLYYAYGYGLVLAILIKLFPNINLYQVAVIFNAILLILEFWLIHFSLKKIFRNFNTYTVLLISFCLTVYPYNLFYVHLNVSEVLLTFLFWLTIYIFVNTIDSNTLVGWGFLAVPVAFSYMVHQRSIGMIIALIIVMGLLLLTRHIRLRQCLVFFAILIIIMLTGGIIKAAYTDAWFTSNSSVSVNDYSGQTGKLGLVFSLEGIPYLLFGIIGKWFGICASTFFLVSIGLFGLLKDSFLEIRIKWRDRQFSKNLFSKIFFVLCFLAAFGINVIFMIYPTVNADYLIYTRYTETAVLPIVAYGFYRLYKNDISWKEVMVNISIFVCSLGLVLFRIKTTDLNSYVGQANVAIWDLYSSGMDIQVYFSLVTARTIVVFILLYIFILGRKYLGLCVACVSALWLSISWSAYEKDNSSRNNMSIAALGNVIQEITDLDYLYYYNKDGYSISMDVFNIQLQNIDVKIDVLTSPKELEKLEEGSYFFVNRVTDLDLKKLDASVIAKANKYTLLKK